MPKIFISYRRDDCRETVDRLHERLYQAFGRDVVFRDIDSIPAGVDFRTTLKSALDHCNVMLAVIGPRWQAKDERGRPRLANPNDFVRVELEEAFRRQVRVIPLLAQGANVPEPSQLPASLQALSFHQAAVLRPDPDFQHDMERLIRTLERSGIKPRQRLTPFVLAAAGLLVLALATAVAFWNWRPHSNAEPLPQETQGESRKPSAPAAASSALMDPDSLVDLITVQIEPDTWDAVGGPSSISITGFLLTVRASEDTQDAIQQLLTQLRKAASLPEQPPPGDSVESRAEAAVRQALLANAEIELIETPLVDALVYISDMHSITIRFDQQAFDEAGVRTDAPVTGVWKNTTLRRALNDILLPHNLRFVTRDDGLLVTTEARYERFLVNRVYNVRDLVGGSSSPSTRHEPQ